MEMLRRDAPQAGALVHLSCIEDSTDPPALHQTMVCRSRDLVYQSFPFLSTLELVSIDRKVTLRGSVCGPSSSRWDQAWFRSHADVRHGPLYITFLFAREVFRFLFEYHIRKQLLWSHMLVPDMLAVRIRGPLSLELWAKRCESLSPLDDKARVRNIWPIGLHAFFPGQQ